MKLHLALRVNDDATNSVWRRTVERPYPDVPRAGDWLYLDDEETKALPVRRVTWRSNGEVTLGFGTIDEPPEYLHSFGFVRDG